jgi:hypothetical protein
MTEIEIIPIELEKPKKMREFLAELGNRVINEIYITFDEKKNEVVKRAKLLRVKE